MAGGRIGPEWEELANIDYFLEHLARAVERGEVHRASYDLLAPRYLQRRAELAVILERRAHPAAPVAPHPTPGQGTPAQPMSATVRTAQPYAVVPTRPAPKPVPWATVLTITGAFLVIVAAAIFAVATWGIFGVGFKLVFLGTFTAAFYGAGYLVRKRLDLAAGAIALLAVGSAMLLFDGWIAIDGYHLQGAWPWVMWLAVCSGVYWATETAIGGAFFGVSGAAAQVAWVWLLGDGLGWPNPMRLAGVSVVALAWTITGERARDRKPFASLATVLRWAGPAAVAACALGMVIDLNSAPAGWHELASALVIGTCATAIGEAARFPRGVAAIAHLPVFLALASMTDFSGVELWHAGVLFGMAAGYAIYELYRGGWGHAALAFLSELGAWFALGRHFAWSHDVIVAVMAGVAVSWVLAAHLLERAGIAEGAGDERFRGAVSLKVLGWFAGYGLLVGSTLAMPATRGVVPLLGMPVEPRDALLALAVFGAWALVSVVRKAPLPALAAMLTSLYASAALMAWMFPDLHSALYATGLLAVAGIWRAGRRVVRRLTGLDPGSLGWVARGLALLFVAGGLLGSLAFFDPVAWQSATLLAAGALYWLADCLTAKETRLGLGLSSAQFVFAVAMLLVWASDASWLRGWPGALAGLALVTAALPLRSRPGWGGSWAFGAACAGTLVSLAALGDWAPLALALGLAGMSFALLGLTARMPESLVVGSLIGFGAIVSALARLDGPAWATVAVMGVVSFAFLVPLVVLRRQEPRSLPRRWVDSATASGALGLTVLLALAYVSWSGAAWWFGPWTYPAWADLGVHGLAAALVLLGGYVLAAAAFLGMVAGPYVGVGLLLLAYWAEVVRLDGFAGEWVTTPLALYLLWAGYRYARTNGARVSPAADLATVVVGLGLPTFWASTPGAAAPWTHLVWAVGLALVAITAGVALRVRAYFFGGVASVVITSVVRSWVYLVSFWWLVLGFIGVTMLVIALTWEREQRAMRDVRHALAEWR